MSQLTHEPGRVLAATRELAHCFIDDCRGAADALELELIVAQYLPRFNGGLELHGTGALEALLGELERRGDHVSHAALRALWYLGTGELQRLSADAAARLGERGVGLPLRLADVGLVRPTGAWRAPRGGNRGEYALFVEFEHPRAPTHSLAVLVDPRRGGLVKHLALLRPMDDLGDDGPFRPEALEKLDLGVARELMRDLLVRTFGRGTAGTDDYSVLIAAARARQW